MHLTVTDPRWNALQDPRVTLAAMGLPPLADDDAPDLEHDRDVAAERAGTSDDLRDLID